MPPKKIVKRKIKKVVKAPPTTPSESETTKQPVETDPSSVQSSTVTPASTTEVDVDVDVEAEQTTNPSPMLPTPSASSDSDDSSVEGILEFRLFDFNVCNTTDDTYYDDVGTTVTNPAMPDMVEEPSEEASTFERFEIQMFGINQEGKTCSLIVKNYRPFFYIKVPNTWTMSTKRLFEDEIKKKSGKSSKSIYSMKLVQKKKLYGFDAGTYHKFIEVTFDNTNAMNRVKYLFYKKSNGDSGSSVLSKYNFKGAKLELYESQIPPLLRYFHIQNISPSGWVMFDTENTITPDFKTTTCHFEYIIDCHHILPLNDKEDLVPYKICSFDIEASSSHGDFPIPVKNYKKLATNIVDYFRTMSQDTVNTYANDCDSSEGDQLLNSMIQCAFNITDDNELKNDIQCVYPKLMPKPKTIEKLAANWSTFKLSKLKKMKYSTKSDHDDNNGGTSLNLSQYDYRDDDDDGGNDTTHNDSSFAPRSKKRRTGDVPMTLINKMKIIEIVTHPSIEYDDKINILIESFSGFPPLKGDEVTFIGSTFMKYGTKEPYLNHCAVLDTCDDIPGAKNTEIVTCDTERDVLMEWVNIIQREDPDVIIGYNIFGFDYDFMFRRAIENKCVKEFLKLSRNQDEICGKQVDINGKKVWKIEQSKIVIASGEHNLSFIKMNGRIQVDLYNYFRRDYNLPSYKLDYVSSQFIGDGVKKLEFDHDNKVTTIRTKNVMGLDVGSFIHFEETGHSSELYKDGAKFNVTSVDKVNKTFTINSIEDDVDMSKNVRWGLAKDDVTPQDIFRLSKESAAGRSIIAKYCIQDCNLIHHLMNKIDVMTGFIEMAKICSVPIDFLIMRGQGIKLTSFIAKKCREKNTLMPVLERPDYRDPMEDEQWNGYDGAIVLDPKCNLYLDNPVACVDYASLYPSSMISENLSHDSKVWVKEYDLDDKLLKMEGSDAFDNLEDFKYVDIKYDTYSWKANTRGKLEKVVSGYRVCRWAQFPNNEKAIMPSILEELLAARKSTRKLIPKQNDEFMKNVLDKRQLSYKITANSLYGQCGAKTSTFFEKDVAASTTATGRMLLTYAKRVVEEVYGNKVCKTEKHGTVLSKAEYIYGDTDSVFFTFNLQDHKTGEPIRGKKALEITIELAKEAGELATKYLKKPHDLEYEKTFMPFCLLSKKRYVGMLYEEDPNKCYQKSMGIVLKRRDNAPIVKDVYGGIIDILMDEQDIGKAVQFLKTSLQNMINEKFPIEKLIISKSLRSNYKNPKQIAHKVLADRMGKRDPGNKPASGDRIPYAYIKVKDKRALQGDKIEHPGYIQEKNLQLDYAHYITNQIMKPVQQLLALVLEQIPEYAQKPLRQKAYREHLHEMKRLLNSGDITGEQFEKKHEDYKNREIKSLLFDKYIEKTLIERNNITRFFRQA